MDSKDNTQAQVEDVSSDFEQYDTSEPQEVNKAKKKAGRNRADRLRFVSAAMSTKEGRAWFHYFLTVSKLFNTPFTDDPYRTAFNCGQMNVGLMMLADLQEAAPKEYLQMINENNNVR